MLASCPACGAVGERPLVDLGDVPALCGALWDDAARARNAARGHLDLVVCPSCSHVWNRAFDERLVDYDGDYDNSLHHSPTFQRFADGLADRLSDDHDLRGRHVLEIGSGKGEFLTRLCKSAGCTGTGYDPTYSGAADDPAVTLVDTYFPVGSAVGIAFDLLVCRHVLEHLSKPMALLTGLVESARASGSRPVFYLEVPSAAFNFGPAGLWDCIYPHVSYFSAPSLRRLVERAGLRVERLDEVFHGQFLSVEATLAEPDEEVGAPNRTEVASHLALLDSFVGRLEATVTEWSDRLSTRDDGDERIALWGAGAKGVVFCNAVDVGLRLRAVTDVNPGKWGRYLPGTGHEVVDPSRLPADVTAVLITNPAYRDEIRQQLATMGVRADVIAV